ncbi:MAG: hypothetical protein Q8Q03_01385 [bacterium]|nr:hypothetical protein [bacterium]
MENNHTQKSSPNAIPMAVVAAAAMISIAWIVNDRQVPKRDSLPVKEQSIKAVMLGGGSILPLEIEEKLLDELTAAGVIDSSKISRVTELNLLWAFGLANKNRILESGPMAEMRYGGPETMASVGGWTVSNGPVMDHYSMHDFVRLTEDQQMLVEKVAKGIYRPCCGNSTHFPDCNHGMAMLGLLELMASRGASEGDMWKAALIASSSWFPDTYQTIAQYLKQNGIDWKNVDPEKILGQEYSSSFGYAKISSQTIMPQSSKSASRCSI